MGDCSASSSYTYLYRTHCHKFCCIFPQQFVWERGPLSEFSFGAFPRKELQQQCLFFCGPLRKFLWLLRANWCRQCLLCIEVKMLSSSAAGMLFASMNLCQGCNPWEFPQERFYTSNQVMMSESELNFWILSAHENSTVPSASLSPSVI